MGYIKKLKNNELVGGTDKTTIYPVTSTEAVFEEVSDSEFKSQKYLNNHITNERIVDNTIENQKLKDDTIDMGKLNTQLKTIIQNAYDASWKVKEEPFSLETKYDANDVVYDPDTNSSYVSLTADNQGNPVNPEDEGYVEGKWRIIINGISAVQATEEIEETKNELIDYIQENLKDQVDDEIADAESRVAAAEQYAQGVIAEAEETARSISGIVYQTVATTPNYTDTIPVQNKAVTAQIGYYTCTGGSGATIIVDDTDAAAFTPVKGGQIKILMTQKSAVTSGNVQLQFGSVTATKKDLLYNEETVSSNNTWEVGEIIAVYYDGTRYHASSAQGGSNKKINAYLYDDATLLSAGQVYNIGDSVKTADNQLRIITKDIKAFSLSEELKEGDIKKRSGATYRAASAVSTFNPSTEYAEGSYALGSMTVYTLSVTAESVTAGNITVNGTEVAIEETDNATAIAAKISSALNIDGWTDSASENIVTVRCNTIGNNTTTITISDTDNTGVVVDGISTPSETGTSVIRKYDGETWSNATADVMIEDEILVSVDEAWLIENATQQNSITQELTLHDANVFKWANASCGSSNTSKIQVSVSNNKYKATGIGSTDATDTNRTAYFKFFSTSPLEEGKVYRISFDYSYKFSKRVSVGFGSSNTVIAHNLFTVSSSQERTGLHYEADIAYNSTYNNIVSTYVRSAVGDYLEITNVSIAERKTVKDTLLESMERIDEHETRLTTIEHTKAVELFDFDSAELKNQVGDAGDVTTALKDTIDDILKFTVVNGSTTAIRRAYIVLPDGLTVGQTYKISFNHTNVSRSRTDIKIGTASNYVSVKSVYNTAGTVNYTYTHFSGSKYLMFEFYHPDANDYIYISNLSIRLFGDVQNVADDFSKYIGINKKSIAELEEKLIENGAISIPPKNNFQWYSYSGAKILQPNRVGIETIIAYNSTGSTDYSGYPQGFSIWGDYAIGYNAGMPRLIVFNIKERRKVGQFGSGVSGTVAARHCNSVDFTNAYYEEGDEFPLLYVSGSEDRDGTNLSGVDYLMRISRNGDIFTSTLIQTITVRNENTDGTVYHNTAIDRMTGKLWLRRGSSRSGGDGKADLFAVDLPAFKDSEGTRIPTADILIDLDSPTSTIDGYNSPQGGCIRDGIGYFAYGTQNDPAIVQAVDLVTGSQINAVNLRNMNYSLEIEDLAFWGDHMITSGGGSSAIYELHWE